MAWNDDLTGSALQIASCQESPLRVMAGPGTGKSYSMKRRIHRLLDEGVNPQKIIAITFTRTAADDMVKELSKLGVTGCTEIQASTLHSFCYSVLMKNDVLSYLNRFPRPLLTFAEKRILKFEAAPLLADLKLLNSFGNKKEMCRRIRAFEAAWARLQSDVPGWPIESDDKAFHRALMDWLIFHNSILIGELVPLTLSYFRHNPLTEELNSFEHIIVDEFQDLNKAEQTIIDLIAENGKCFIIGDEDQSIYSFRFAHPEGIVTYNQTHANTHDEPLTECRRCPKRIVKIADHLIRHNHPVTITSRLIPREANADGEIHILQWQDIKNEVDGIANYIHYLINEKDYNPNDVLILCSRRLISYLLLKKIKELGISIHTYYYDGVLEDKNGQKAFTLLSLLVNKDDKVSLRFRLGLDSNNWLAPQYAKIKDYSVNNNISPWEVLDGLQNDTIKIPNCSQIKKAFQELNDELGALQNLSVIEVFEKLFPDDQDWSLPIRNALLTKITSTTELEKLFTLIRNFISQPESPEEGDYVKLMSLHKSKGLTSKVVIIPSVIQGLIPRRDDTISIQEQELELKEQRRLFYVAITRATEILVISSFREMNISDAFRLGAIGSSRSGINRQVNMSSQFINELGPEAPKTKQGSVWANGGYH